MDEESKTPIPVYTIQHTAVRYPNPQSGSNLTLDSVICVTTSFALGLILPKKNIDVKTLKITQNSYQTHSPEPSPQMNICMEYAAFMHEQLMKGRQRKETTRGHVHSLSPISVTCLRSGSRLGCSTSY